VTEDYERHCEEYELGAMRALRIFLIAFFVIILVTLGVSGWYQDHRARQQQSTHNIKHPVEQRFDYWNQEKR
jgi:hypothetical protein